jgi:hypothetical protein
MQIIHKDFFLSKKKEQQYELWTDGNITSKSLIDFLLVHGTDDDIEWLCHTFDPLEGTDEPVRS